MKKEIYVCDVCGTERKEANHWFMGEAGTVWFSLTKWNSERVIRQPNLKHICGQECAHKSLDDYMSRPEEAKAARVEVGQ